MEKPMVSCNWLWISTCLMIFLSCLFLTYGSRVFVGCLAGSYGIYSAESNGNLNPDHLNFRQIMTLSDPPNGITHDNKSGDIFVTEFFGRVVRANQDGSGMETVINLKGEYPYGIYVTDDQIFWSEYSEGRIHRAGIDGNDRSKIVSKTDILGIAGMGSSIYWAEYSGLVKMAEFDSNGTSAGHAVIRDCIGAYAVTIDYDENKLYAASGGRIIKYDLSTGKRMDINETGDDVVDVTILGDSLLITDYSNGLKAIHKDNGSLLPLNVRGLESCTDFFSIHATNGWVHATTTFDPSAISSISYFDNVASIFPENTAPGVVANSSIFGFYLFEQATLEEIINFDGKNDIIVTIPKGFLESEVENGYITVVFLMQTPAKDTLYNGDDSDIVYLVGSPWVSVNSFNKNGNMIPVELENEDNQMKITFPVMIPQNTSIQSEGTRRVCAFWDAENNMWSTKGTRTYEALNDDALQTCGFSHLTSFAVLFAINNKGVNEYSHAVDIVVQVGMGISLLALAAGLVICAVLWKRTTLDRENIVIHANLMTAMALAYIMTLAAEGADSNQIGCHIVTILRYNMLIAVFCCMFVEALHLYRMIVLVFGIERNFRVAYIIISWGVPMLMTIITASIGGDNLHNQASCWLAQQFIWAFIAPVVAILTTNLVILVVIVYKTLAAAGLDKDKVQSVRIGLRSAALLLPMVGVAWLIGPLGNLNINVAYVFDVISSLQGLYLVFVTCYINSEVRDAMKREWSRRNGQVEQNRRINVREADNTQETADE